MAKVSKFKKFAFTLMTTTALMGVPVSAVKYQVKAQDTIGKQESLLDISHKKIRLFFNREG